MRFLFTTFAAVPHLQIQVPIAWALRVAGHDVCVASQPDLMPEIERTGLACVPVGDELDLAAYVGNGGELPGRCGMFDIAEDDPGKLSFAYVKNALALYGRHISGYLADDSMLSDLVEFGQIWKPDMILWDAFTYAGPVAAESLGVMHARTLFGPDYIARMLDWYRDYAIDGDDPLTRWLLSRINALGRIDASAAVGEFLTLGRATIDPLPAALRTKTNPGLHLPVRPIPMSASGRVRRDLLSPPSRPRVCLTLGYSSRTYGLPAPAVADILDGLASLDIEVVVTLNSAQLSGVVLPENVVAYDFLPLDHIVPTCAAMISHFGVNTLNVAIRHGVPQLYVGDGVDMWGGSRVADAMVGTGAARAIRSEELTPAAIRKELRTILSDPTYVDAARALQREVSATPSPRQLVPKLERLAKQPVCAP